MMLLILLLQVGLAFYFIPFVFFPFPPKNVYMDFWLAKVGMIDFFFQ